MLMAEKNIKIKQLAPEDDEIEEIEIENKDECENQDEEGSDESCESGDEINENEIDEDDEDMDFNPIDIGQILGNFFVSEDGMTIADSLQGIKKSMDTQNKILMKLYNAYSSK